MDTLKRYGWIVGLLVALAVTLLAPLASPHPDGLERVAEDQGFLDRAQNAPYKVIPEYLFPGIENERVASIVADLVGTVLMFGLGYGLAWALRRAKRAAS